MMALRLTFLAAVLLASAVLAQVEPARQHTRPNGDDAPKENRRTTPAPVLAATEATAFTSLAAATRQAQRLQRPIFVRVGGEDCPWCRKLEVELRDGKLKNELARWVLVALDADKADEAEVRSLGVGPIPALRLLTPTGRQVTAADGFKDVEQLSSWLKKHFDAAASQPSEEQLGDGEPTAEAVQKLVAALQERDPTPREAAMRRLLPYPALAAIPVADTFAAGPLQARLSALELLQEWKAPIAELDPWRPETLTAERVKSITAWASTVKPPAETTEPKSLTTEQLIAARLDLERLPHVPAAEALAIRERLARFRAVLLPEVLARLKDPPSDIARDRLLALRYRLVARDSLALTWPSGLDRLASSDAAQRHEALAELVEAATSADEALLLELFASPDALVRELSLGALNARVGRGATASLTRLLKDPEPNVRAAVLKQLAERPSNEFVPQLAQFVTAEPDADLVVHAVRALAAIDNHTALRALVSLFTHTNWRVRAEAVEAVGKKEQQHGNRVATDSETESAIIKLLDDSDGFVVGRAIKALHSNNSVAKNKAMLKLAEKAPPELAAEAVAELQITGASEEESIASLNKFIAHAQPLIRAAAVRKLSSAATDNGRDAIRTGLRDGDSRVRIAAANAIYAALDRVRNEYDSQRNRNTSGESSSLIDVDTALANVRGYRTWPTWPGTMAELLRPMLKAESPHERIAAMLALIAFRLDDEAMTTLVTTVKAHPAVLLRATKALTWLNWQQRVEAYQAMLSVNLSMDQLSDVVTALAHNGDKRGIPLYWDLTQRTDLKGEVPGQLVYLLEAAYPAIERKTALAELQERVKAGPDMQRIIALNVLTKINAEEAGTAAQQLLDDPAAAKALGREALHAKLHALSLRERTVIAVAAIDHAEMNVRAAAALFLASEQLYRISRFHQGNPYYHLNSPEEASAPSEARPFAPQAPPKLPAAPLKAMLNDQNPETAAAAGYLLTLLGDASGLPAVVHQWRMSGGKEGLWARLLARAVTALDDDANVRSLEELYRKLPAEEFQVAEFYWTIRRLEGPNALRLRKQIRKEVGMDQLRGNSATP